MSDILLTERGTLYCGYTDDIEKRYKQHIEGKGAKYTRANKPVKLVYQQVYNTKTEAMREEYRIKHKLTRAQKLKLIDSELNQQDYFSIDSDVSGSLELGKFPV